MPKFSITPIGNAARMAALNAWLDEMNREYFERRAPALPRELIEGSPRDFNRATAEASIAHFKTRIGQ